MNASILKNKKCKDCGWPIIDACCNASFQNYKDASKWDWWQYCSNKGCKNHEGEGIFQDTPDWIIDDLPQKEYLHIFKVDENTYVPEMLPAMSNDLGADSKQVGNAFLSTGEDFLVQAKIIITDEVFGNKLKLDTKIQSIGYGVPGQQSILERLIIY